MYRTTGQRVFGYEQVLPVIRPGLLGLWIGGSGLTWLDRSGRANHGALTAGPLWTLGKDGKRDALSLNGTGAYINIGNEPAFDFEYTDPFTLGGWFKTTTLATIQFLIAKRASTGGTRGYSLAIRGDLAGDPYELTLSSDSSAANLIQVRAGSATLDGQEVAVLYNGSGLGAGVDILVDGIPQTPTIVTDTLTTSILNNFSLTVGVREATNLPFSGIIDYAYVYNKRVSIAEIALLAQRDTPIVLPTSRRSVQKVASGGGAVRSPRRMLSGMGA